MVGIPLRLLAPHDAPVDDGRHLAIAAAQVEADAASVEVPAERRRGVRTRGRKVAGRHDLDRVIVDALADDLGVEAAVRGVAIIRPQSFRHAGRRVEMDPEPAVRPQRELDQALEHREVRVGRFGIGARQQGRRQARDRAVLLLEREARLGRVARRARVLLKRTPGERGRAKEGIQHRRHGRADGRQSPDCVVDRHVLKLRRRRQTTTWTVSGWGDWPPREARACGHLKNAHVTVPMSETPPSAPAASRTTPLRRSASRLRRPSMLTGFTRCSSNPASRPAARSLA